VNLKKVSDQELAYQFRTLRNAQRPLFNELARRGFTVTEIHGHSRVPVTGFENICISKPTTVKL
jgi:hypothetical protein